MCGALSITGTQITMFSASPTFVPFGHSRDRLHCEAVSEHAVVSRLVESAGGEL